MFLCYRIPIFQLETLGRECVAPRETLDWAVSSLSGGTSVGDRAALALAA